MNKLSIFALNYFLGGQNRLLEPIGHLTHWDFRIKGGSLELHYNLLGFVWSMLNWRVFSSCRKDGVSSHIKKVFCWVFLTHFDPVTKRDYLLKEFVVFVKPFMNVFSIHLSIGFGHGIFSKTFKRFTYISKEIFLRQWQICLHGKGSFTNYVDTILTFFDHLPPSVDIFYVMNIDKKWTFLDHLPISSCTRSLWTTPKLGN